MAQNIFDQFDDDQEETNIFDQFDEPVDQAVAPVTAAPVETAEPIKAEAYPFAGMEPVSEAGPAETPEQREARGFSEIKAYEPTLFDKVKDIFPGDKARASNERIARQVAEEQGVSIEEVYESIGGAHPMLNPEGRAPIRALTEGAEIVAKQLPDVPAGVANTVLRTIRGGDIDIDDTGWIDRAIKETEIEQPADADPNYQQFQNLGKNIGYSLTTMVSGALAFAGGSLATTPVGGAIAAGATSAGVAFRGSKDDFMDRVRDHMDEQYEELYGKEMTQKDWDSIYKQFNSLANQYGAWEAIPEAAGNLIFIRAFAKPLRGAAGSKLQAFKSKANEIAARTAEVMTSENATEVATALGQNKVEREAGLTDRKLTLSGAIRETVVPTTLITGLMGGAGAAGKTVIGKALQKKMTPTKAPETPFTPTHKAAGGIDVQPAYKDGRPIPDTYVDAQGNMIRDPSAVAQEVAAAPIDPFDANANAEAIKAEVMGTAPGIEIPAGIQPESQVAQFEAEARAQGIIEPAQINQYVMNALSGEQVDLVDYAKAQTPAPEVTRQAEIERIQAAAEQPSDLQAAYAADVEREAPAEPETESVINPMKPSDYDRKTIESELNRLSKEGKDIEKARGGTIFEYLASKGGLNIDSAVSSGMDKADARDSARKGVPFGKPLFKQTGGMTMDEAAEAMAEIGVPGVMTGQGPDSNAAFDMIYQGIKTGEPITIPGDEALVAEQDDRRLRNALETERYENLLGEIETYDNIKADKGVEAADKWFYQQRAAEAYGAEEDVLYRGEKITADTALSDDAEALSELVSKALAVNPDLVQSESERLVDATDTEIAAAMREIIGTEDRRAEIAPVAEDKRTGERRVDIGKRKRVDELTLEEARTQLLTSEKGKIRNERAYDEEEKLAHQAFFDIDDFKNVNSRMTIRGADLILGELGQIMSEEAGDIVIPYHLHGDEYVAQSDDLQALEDFGARVQAKLKATPVEFKLPTGEIVVEKDIGVSYGTGKTLHEAETNLAKDKQARKEAGIRKGDRGEPDALPGPVAGRDRGDVTGKQVAAEKLDEGDITPEPAEAAKPVDVPRETTTKALEEAPVTAVKITKKAEKEASKILKDAGITGKDRLETMAKFRDGTYSLDDLKEAYPVVKVVAEEKPVAEMSPEEITAEIEEIGDRVKARRAEAEPEGEFIPPELVQPDLAYLTDEEKTRLNNLKQALPSAGEEALDARERNIKRAAERKKPDIGEESELYSGYERDTSKLQVEQPTAFEQAESQLDLFAPANVPNETAQEQAQDSFDVVFKHVEVGSFNAGTDTVNNAEDAAHVIASIRKHAQETMLAIVTDKNNKVIHVIRHTKGLKDASSVSVSELVAGIGGTEGAENVWFAHNHPSGNVEPSASDSRITDKLNQSMEGSGVKLQGHVIVGEGSKISLLAPDGVVIGHSNIKPMPRSKQVPMTERVLRRRRPNENVAINGEKEAANFARKMKTKNGLILMNNRHVPIGVLSLSLEEMGNLRTTGSIPRILKAIDSTNTAATIIVSESHDISKNLGNYLTRLDDIRLLDAMVHEPGGGLVSKMSLGQDVGSINRPFFSRTGDGVVSKPDSKYRISNLPRDMREELFNEHAMNLNPEATERGFYANRVPSGMMNIKDVQVDNIPKNQLEYLMDIDPADLPPIVISDGRLIDGQHRIQAARLKGVDELRYIDVTGLIDTEVGGYISELPSRAAEFSRDEAAIRPSLTTKELNAVISRVTGIKDPAGFDGIVVAADFESLPNAIKVEAKKQGSTGEDIRGVYHNDIIYLVESNITSEADVELILFHEGTHRGIEEMSNDTGVKRAMNKLWMAVGGTEKFNKIVADAGINLDAYVTGVTAKNADGTYRFTKEQREHILMNELLAHIGQTGSKSLKQKALDLVGAIRAWLRNNGYLKLAELGVTDLSHLAKTARERGLGKKAAVDLVLADDVLFSLYSKYSNPRAALTNVRGGWTKNKIRKELKQAGGGRSGRLPHREIAKFDSAEEFADNIYYHGTGGYVSHGLKPSITMSESEAERSGGGGYGERYWAVSLSKSKNLASNFTGQSSFGNVYPVILKKNSNVISRPDLHDASELEDIIEDLWNQGVDAVKLGDWSSEFSEQELAVLNPYAMFKYNVSESFAVFNKKKFAPLTDKQISDIYENAVETTQNLNEIRKLPREERDKAVSDIPDIMFSRQGPPQSPGVLYSRAREPVGDSLGMPEETRTDKFVRLFQDSFNRVKALQKTIAERGGEVTYESDIYLAEERSSGKITARLSELDKGSMRPLVAQMAKDNITIEELDNYLVAKHAPERNKYIASINPDMPDGGSGVTNAEAQEMIDSMADKLPALEEAANRVYAVNNKNLDDLVEGGHLTQEVVDGWRDRWDYYVPLKGKEGEEGRPATGQGYSISGAGIKTAFGRGAGNIAESPTAHTFAQAENTIVRTEKTKVGQALVNLMRANPDSNFWTISERTFQHFVDLFGEPFEGYDTVPEGLIENVDYHRTRAITEAESKAAKAEGRAPVPQVVYRLDPRYKQRDDVLSVMIEGRELLINIKDQVVAEQLKKMNASQLNALVAGAGVVNRYLAMINTALNPEFVITNLERDFQTAMVNLGGEQSAKMAYEVMKSMPAAVRGIWQATFETKGTSEMRTEFEEMQKEGGTIGFFGLEDVNTKIKHIQNRLENKQTILGKSKRGLTNVRDAILDANLSVENAARLAAYKVAKEQWIANGMSPKEAKAKAASLAKNLTVNFNRKGELAPVLNSAYLFFNASTQGSARIIMALKNPRVQKIVGGIAATSFALAMYNQAAGGDDDDGIPYWDKISDYTKQTNLIIMHPDGSGEYSKVRLPYGYNVFFYAGTAMHDMLFNDKKSVIETSMSMVSATMNAFNPIQGADILDTLTPTVLKPFEQDVRNTNFMGAKITPDFPFDSYDRPDSQKFFKSTNPELKEMMAAINEATGGDETHAGLVDISPETVKHYVGWLTGGAGLTATRTLGTAIGLATGEEIEAKDVPLLRTLGGKPSAHFDTERFYNAMKEVAAVEAKLKMVRGTDEYREYLDENREVHKLALPMSKYKKRIKNLRSRRDKAYADNDNELAREYSEKIRQEMMKFSKKYDEATE